MSPRDGGIQQGSGLQAQVLELTCKNSVKRLGEKGGAWMQTLKHMENMAAHLIPHQKKENTSDNYPSQMTTTKIWVNGDLTSTMSANGHWGTAASLDQQNQ